MDFIEIGTAELDGRTKGKTQLLERGAGLQVIGWFNEVERRTGYRLTPNEGARSKADMELVRNAYVVYLAGGPWAPVAAALYASRHSILNHPNAVDVGGPGGEVIPAAVHAVAVEIGLLFGIAWTGAGFRPTPEWWHFEATRANAQIVVPEGTIRTGPVTAAAEQQKREDDDVNTVIITDSRGNIWVCDIGHHTKWNIIRGLKSVEEATTRLRDYKNLGVKVINGKQNNRFVAGLDDITQIDYAKAA